MIDGGTDRTWPSWPTAPDERSTFPPGAARRSRPASGPTAIGPRRPPAPRGRLRRSRLHHVLLRLVVPLAALLVVGWGFSGMPRPPGPTGTPGTPAAAVAGDRPWSESTERAGLATPATPAGPASPRGSTRSAPPPGVRSATPDAGTPTAPVAVDCAPPAALPPAGPSAVVTTEIANLREQPGLSCAVLGEIPAETSLTVRSGIVRGDDVGWLLVEAEGTAGWVSARLVVPAEQAPTAIPPATHAGTVPPATATAAPGVPTAAGCRPPSSPPPVRDRWPVVTTTAVNLRQGPGLGCDIVTVLGVGTEAIPRSGPVRADGRLWIMIAVDGTSGWVATDFLAKAD